LRAHATECIRYARLPLHGNAHLRQTVLRRDSLSVPASAPVQTSSNPARFRRLVTISRRCRRVHVQLQLHRRRLHLGSWSRDRHAQRPTGVGSLGRCSPYSAGGRQSATRALRSAICRSRSACEMRFVSGGRATSVGSLRTQSKKHGPRGRRRNANAGWVARSNCLLDKG
jgi:hypothetical protein